MKEYEAFKAAYLVSAREGGSVGDRSVLDRLKAHSVLVEELAGHKSLAEDIFANALEIEESLKKLLG